MIFLYPFLAVGRLWYVEEVCTQKHILRVSVCLLCITAVWLVCSCAVGVYALDWADIVTVECWRKALSAVERQILSICSCSVVFLWLYPSASITLTTTTKNASLDQAMYHKFEVSMFIQKEHFILSCCLFIVINSVFSPISVFLISLTLMSIALWSICQPVLFRTGFYYNAGLCLE